MAALAIALATESLGASGGDSRPWSRHAAAWPVAIGDYGLPPPASSLLLRKFHHLVALYEAAGGESMYPFAQWLMLNGITNPHELSCLMWLWRSYCASKH